MYYSNVIISIVTFGILAFIYNLSIEAARKSGDYTIVWIMNGFTTFFMALAFFSLKFVYLRVNLVDIVIEYGSVFFYQEASYDQVKSIKKIWFARGVYKFKIGDSNHFVQSSSKDMKSFKEVLGLRSQD
jgi:hypothetical protein